MGAIEFIRALLTFPSTYRELKGIRREIEVDAYFSERDFIHFEEVTEDWIRCHIIV